MHTNIVLKGCIAKHMVQQTCIKLTEITQKKPIIYNEPVGMPRLLIIFLHHMVKSSCYLENAMLSRKAPFILAKSASGSACSAEDISADPC